MSGAHPQADRAGGLRPEPAAQSQPKALIPCAGQIYRSELYAMTTIDTGREPDGSPISEVWTFASEDDGVIGHGWLEVTIHEVVPTENSGTLAVYYRQWFAPDGEPAWGTRAKRTVGSLASLKSLIRRRKMTAQAIEARRAETGTGSVHESAVPQGMRPEDSQ